MYVVAVGAAAWIVNPVSATFVLLGALTYGGVYTVGLKRRTPWNIVIGGLAGSFPPMVGWAAVTGGFAFDSLYPFAIVFAWIGNDDARGGRRFQSDFSITLTAMGLAGFQVVALIVRGASPTPEQDAALRKVGVSATWARPQAPPWLTIPMCRFVVVPPGSDRTSTETRELLAWSRAARVEILDADHESESSDTRRRRFQLVRRMVQAADHS